MVHPRILCNCSIVHRPEAKLILESVREVTYVEHTYPRLLELIGGYEALLEATGRCFPYEGSHSRMNK